MANTMTTYVKIGNLNEETHKKFVELFEEIDDLLNHYNKLYGTDFKSFEDIDREWMSENVGTKWLGVECDDLDYHDNMDLVIESSWAVPTQYLQKIVEFIGGDVVVYGTYEDDGYDPIGAFVYAVGYDDIEDYDEVETDKMFQDDDYMEEIYDGLYELRDSLYEGYLEVKNEE